jgi:hypothetical protein
MMLGVPKGRAVRFIFCAERRHKRMLTSIPNAILRYHEISKS